MIHEYRDGSRYTDCTRGSKHHRRQRHAAYDGNHAGHPDNIDGEKDCADGQEKQTTHFGPDIRRKKNTRVRLLVQVLGAASS